MAKTTTTTTTEAIASPNETLDLSRFDYSNMKGQMFEDYNKLINTLKHNDFYDFETMKVRAVKKVRYKGVQGSPIDIVGFELKEIKPINTTRIPLKYALEMNGRMTPDEEGNYYLTGGQFENSGIYYLLKK
jgi:hypothetical protein